MWKFNNNIFSKDNIATQANRWDAIALILIVAVILSLGWTSKQMVAPYHIGDQLPISLAVNQLPAYAMRTTVRMLIAMLFSLLFTFIFATWAAKNKYAERIIIPTIDILQSVPVLGFLSIGVPGFIILFPGKILGLECAAIFAIFAAQAWNIALGFYQSLITLPQDMQEAADMLQLSKWQRFWRVDVPFAIPSMIWNMMMSMSAGWFFVVASEAISIANNTLYLPGIGSYIAVAIMHADKKAVWYAIITMFIVILIYDQLLFRPLVAWAEKFKAGSQSSEEYSKSWVSYLMQRTRLLRYLGQLATIVFDYFVNLSLFRKKPAAASKRENKYSKLFVVLWYLLTAAFTSSALLFLWYFISYEVGLHEVLHVSLLAAYTAVRVFLLIIICSVIWVPIGVWVGLRPKVAKFIQPIAQFLAAFPANLLFPIVVIVIIKYHLNPEIYTTPLMILGTQWYLLFNVIAGTMALPKELSYAAKNFNVRGFLWWKRLILPAIFPYYVTGAISAAGGAWNASIVAEVVHWGNITLRATGIGEYITQYTIAGDYPRIALGISVMCVYVLIFNRLLWQPLYRLAESRFQLTEV